MRKQTRGIGTYFIILAIVVIAMFLSDNLYNINRNNYNYENFKIDLGKKIVDSVDIFQNQATPTGEVEVIIGKDKNQRNESFYVPDVNEVVNLLRQEGFTSYVMHDITKQSWLVTLMPYMLIFVMFFIMMMMMSAGPAMGGGGGAGNAKMVNFGKSRARMSSDKDKRVTFNDVAGLKEEKDELEEIVDFLKNPAKYRPSGNR